MATGGPAQSFEFPSSDPSPPLSSGSEDSSMSDSRYGGVVFKDVSESYPTDGDIVIRYVNKSGQPESIDDSIGLFVIGWKKVSEAVAILRAIDHVVEEGTGDKKLIMSSTLFCDKITDGQFYQLCYISYTSKPYKNSTDPTVIGASCAFCIRRASSDDMLMLPDRLSLDRNESDRNESDETDDEEFIVVKSEQALIHERLQSLVTNNGLLEFQCKSLAQKLQSVEAELSRVKSEKVKIVQSVEAELSRVKSEKVKIEGQMRTGQDTVMHVTHLLSEIRRKESVHENMMTQLRQEKNRLEMELKQQKDVEMELRKEKKRLEMEVESVKQECMIVLRKEEQIKSEHDETMHLVTSLLDEKERWIEEKEKMVKLLDEKERWIEEKEKMAKMQSDQKSMIDGLKEESSKLASEKEQVSIFLRQTSDELVHKDSELKEVQKQLDDKKGMESELVECRTLNANLKQMLDDKKGMESELAECRTLNANLKRMVQVLQSDLAQTELKLESQAKSSASVKAVSADQEATIEDLTRRLKKAAEEYVELKRSKVKTETKYEKLKTKVDRYLKIKPTTENPSGPEGSVVEAVPSTGAIPKVRISHERSSKEGIKVESEVCRIETEVKGLLLDESDNMDADIVTLPCSICREEIICTVKDMRPMTIHLEQIHRQRVCPVCSQLFDQSMEGIDEYFHLHVENHFDVPHIYPSLGSGFEAIGGAN